jgi:hypothetical protein
LERSKQAAEERAASAADHVHDHEDAPKPVKAKPVKKSSQSPKIEGRLEDIVSEKERRRAKKIKEEEILKTELKAMRLREEIKRYVIEARLREKKTLDYQKKQS